MSRVFSLEAEQAVLGALLQDPSALDRIKLQAQEFHDSRSKAIFGSIERLSSARSTVDAVSVFEELTGRSIEFGGLSYLIELADCVASARAIERHAKIVSEMAALRDLQSRLDQAQEVAAGAGTLAEKVDAVAALLNGIDAGNSESKPRPMAEVMVAVIDGLNAAAEGLAPGWSTGLPRLDDSLNGGLRGGKVYIVAARPGVGKTSLTGQILVKLASSGKPGLMLSQEMPAEELGQRALANQARVSFGHIQTGRLSEIEWGRIASGVDVLGPLNLHVDDEPGLNVRAINSKARSIKGLKVLALDYLQLSEGEGDTRSAQVGSISRSLKKLAKQLDIAVICLSQLNREVDKRPGQRPQLSDLRDSGEIEQDADAILFLWPLEAADTGAAIRHIGLEVAKNRQGRKGAFALEFEGAMQAWRESPKGLDSFGTGKQRSNFE